MLIDLEEAWNALDDATLATSRPYYPIDEEPHWATRSASA